MTPIVIGCGRCGKPRTEPSLTCPTPEVHPTPPAEHPHTAPAAAGPHPGTPDGAAGAELDLDLIEVRLDAATPGPWEHGDIWSWAGVIFGQPPDECALCGSHGEPVWIGQADINGKLMLAHKHRNPDPYQPDHLISGPDGLVAGNYDYEEGGILFRADARFIAAARQDVPALLAEVRRLRGLVSLAAGRVLDAVRQWARAWDSEPFGPAMSAAKARLAAAVDALDADQYEAVRGHAEQQLAASATNQTGLLAGLKFGNHHAEPAPEPGPGWESTARLIAETTRALEAARAELAEVTAERDQRQWLLDASQAQLADRDRVEGSRVRRLRAELAETRAAAERVRQQNIDRTIRYEDELERLRAELATARRDAAADALECGARWIRVWTGADANPDTCAGTLETMAAEVRAGTRPVPGSPRTAPAGGEEHG